MRDDEAARSVVRVRSGDLAVGAGMLLSAELMVTCAHVVSDAVGEEDVAPVAPTDPVDIDLPLWPGCPARRASVLHWRPPAGDGSGDIAVLRLDAPVAAPVPPARRLDEPWGRTFRVLGFPPGREDGVWADGTIRDEQGAGWLQLVGATGPAVGPGFSGAPVWDADGGCVIALAVAADRGSGREHAAYALPIADVLALAPEVLANPYRGLAAFGTGDAEFFCGRDAEIARCGAVLDRERLLVLAGGSGAGKSSLLHAGVAVRERARGRRLATARLTGAASAREVEDALVASLGAAVPDPAWAGLLGGAGPLPAGPQDVLLVVDQFEDLAAVAAEPAAAAVAAFQRLADAGVRVAVTARWATFDLLDGADRLRAAAVGLAPLGRDGLRRAIAQPARRTPGPAFEPGLVERIVDDAADEPGRLPLVQSLLAELWDHPEEGRLTVGAYERAGRVEGALVQSAERAWADLRDTDRAAARSVLVALARPTDTGFVRAAAPVAALGGPGRAVVESLAASRLVTVERGPHGDIVELAHQALIERWPRLRGWLATDADFLRWLAGLRAALARWTSARDPGTLLRGGELETALGWDRARGADLDAEERAFVTASRTRRRRERGLRRGAVTALALLMVMALVLATVLARSNRELTTALGTANARSLAQLAQSALGTDPAKGTQLALAAYAADPADADARSALGQAYLTRRTTTAVRPVPGATVTSLVTDPEVDVAAFPPAEDAPSNAAHGVVVATGLEVGAPTFRSVPGTGPGSRPRAVGGKGRWVVVADASGRLLVWDATRDGPPRDLGRSDPIVELTPDHSHIVAATSTATSTTVAVVALADGAATPTVTLPVGGLADVWLTLDPNLLLVETVPPAGGHPQLTVRDVRTGRVVRTPAPPAGVVMNGAATVRVPDSAQDSDQPILVEDAATGAQRRRITGEPPSGLDGIGTRGAVTTADGRHVVIGLPSPSAIIEALVIDLDTGGGSVVWVPTASGLDPNNRTYSDVAGYLAEQKTIPPYLRASVHGDRLLLADAGVVDTMTLETLLLGSTGHGLPVPMLGDSVVLLCSGGDIYAVQPETRDVLSRAPLGDHDQVQLSTGAAPASVNSGLGVHDLAVVVKPGDGSRPVVRDFSLPDLTLLGEFDLDAAGARGVVGDQESGDRVALGRTGDQVVILSGGVLSWWSAASRTLVAPPTTLTTDPAEAAALVRDFDNNLVTGGPGAKDGVVAVRDADGVTMHRAGPSPAVTVRAPLTRTVNDQLVLADRGLTVVEQPGLLVQRDAVSGAVTAPPLPIPPKTMLLGPGPGPMLVGLDIDTSALLLWDLAADRLAGRLALPGNDSYLDPERPDGARWFFADGPWLAAIDLDAGVWKARLCSAQNRPYTDAERAILPPETATTPPCGS